MTHTTYCTEYVADLVADSLAASLPNGSGITADERHAFEAEVERLTPIEQDSGLCRCQD